MPEPQASNLVRSIGLQQAIFAVVLSPVCLLAGEQEPTAARVMLDQEVTRCSENTSEFGARAVCETFFFNWSIDYGYALTVPGRPDLVVIPVFVGEGSERVFDEFFSSRIEDVKDGEIVYCQCIGEWEGGLSRFRIQRVRIVVQSLGR